MSTFAAHSVPPERDLFEERQLLDLAEAAADAQAARDRAAERARLPVRGEVGIRRQRHIEATAAALKAELALAAQKAGSEH